MTTTDTDQTPVPDPAAEAAQFHRNDRIMGVLTGQASGDALGAGYEFSAIVPKRGQARMLPGTLQRGRAGEWTDDTAMAVCIAQARCDLRRTAAGFLRWFAAGPKDIGNQTRAVLGHAETAANLPGCARAYGEWLASKPVPPGWDPGQANGSLMRTGPVCLPFLGDRDRIAEAALAVSDLTHYDPTGYTGDASVLWSLGIERAIELGGAFEPVMVAEGLDLIPEHRSEFWAGVIAEALDGPSPAGRPNGSAVGAFRAALYSVAQGKGLEDTLQLCVSLGGDTDTTAAICGALAGAWYGNLEVPREWLKILHGYPGLRADDLQRLALEAAAQP